MRYFVEDLKPPATLIWLALVALLGGCAAEPDITQYTIDTRVPEILSQETRMVGAIVPQQDDVWFYKMTGDSQMVQQVAADVRLWVEGLQYSGGEPQLDLPAGWSRKPATSMRFATVEVPVGDPPLEISVSKLAKTDDWPELVSLNVNRWRGQMGLAPSDAQWAGAEVMGSPGAAEPSIWVDLTGEMGEMSMGGPAAAMSGMPGLGPASSMPAGGLPSDALGGGSLGATAGENPGAAAGDAPIEYTVPEGWEAGKMSSMRWAAFNVGSGDGAAELTVIPAGGDVRGNIQRWMGQIRPDGVAPEAVDAVIDQGEEVTVDGRPAQRFLIPGTGQRAQAIDATIVSLGEGFSLFIKMTGDAETVAAQSDAIQQFLDSLKLKQ
jgi:hypothetical protein